MIPNQILDLLVCPKTKNKLTKIDIEIDEIPDIVGSADNENLSEAHTAEETSDYYLYDSLENKAYRVVQGIPVLLYEKAIEITSS